MGCLQKLISFMEETQGITSLYKEQFEICEYTTKEELELYLSHCSTEERQSLLLIASSEDTTRLGASYDVATLGYHKDGHFLSGAEYVVEGFDDVDSRFLERVYKRHHHIPWTIAETEHCVIRELTLADIDSLFALYEDKELTKYIDSLQEYDQEVEHQRAYIDHMYRYFGYGLWLVFYKDTGELIGRAGLEHRQVSWHPVCGEKFGEYITDHRTKKDAQESIDSEMVVELGYLIKAKYQRQGLATEVCQAILQYAQEELEIEEVNCFIEEGNTPSMKLAETLGFFYWETIVEQDRKMLRFIRKSNIIKH